MADELRKYTVVEFNEEDPKEVDVVASNWLHAFRSSNLCKTFWPPTKKQDTLRKLIVQRTTPTDSWIECDVRVMFSTDDFSKAERRCSRALDTSDMNSDYQSKHAERTVESTRPAEAKRKPRPNPRYLSESSSEDETPVVKSQKRRPKTSKSLEPGGSDNPRLPAPPEISFQSPKRRLVSAPSPLPSGSLQRSRSESPLIHPSTSSSLPTVSRSPSPAENADLRSVNIKLEEVKHELRENRKIIRAVLNFLRNKEADKATEEHGLPDGVVLPLTSSEQLQHLEERLANEAAARKSMVIYLSRCGGLTVKDTIARIMGSLVTPEVAVLYNWCGQRGPKQRFSVLKAVVNMIFESVLKNVPTAKANLGQVEEAIQTYLKYVYQRIRSNNNAQRKRQTGGRREEATAAEQAEPFEQLAELPPPTHSSSEDDMD